MDISIGTETKPGRRQDVGDPTADEESATAQRQHTVGRKGYRARRRIRDSEGVEGLRSDKVIRGIGRSDLNRIRRGRGIDVRAGRISRESHHAQGNIILREVRTTDKDPRENPPHGRRCRRKEQLTGGAEGRRSADIEHRGVGGAIDAGVSQGCKGQRIGTDPREADRALGVIELQRSGGFGRRGGIADDAERTALQRHRTARDASRGLQGPAAVQVNDRARTDVQATARRGAEQVDATGRAAHVNRPAFHAKVPGDGIGAGEIKGTRTEVIKAAARLGSRNHPSDIRRARPEQNHDAPGSRFGLHQAVGNRELRASAEVIGQGTTLSGDGDDARPDHAASATESASDQRAVDNINRIGKSASECGGRLEDAAVKVHRVGARPHRAGLIENQGALRERQTTSERIRRGAREFEISIVGDGDIPESGFRAIGDDAVPDRRARPTHINTLTISRI